MKDSLSNSQIELEQRKQVYESAKKVRKHAKAAYEAEVKAFKAHLKSFKQMYKQAITAEKDAKKAYRALQKGLANFEKEISLIEELVNEELTMSTEIEAKEKSPKGIRKAKAAGAEVQPKKKSGRPAKAAAPKTATTKKGRPKASVATGGDDLTKVKGVGDIVADMLKANGVMTFADMAATSYERYKELLKASGMSKFRNPATWAAQAAVLAEAPAAGVEAKASPKPKTSKTAAKKTAAAPKPAGKPGRPKVQKVAEAKPVKAPKAPVRKAKAATGGDDLTKVKGVGDIVADMLKANGVMTFADMAATSYKRYKELLKANGMSKFRNPTTWAAQAAVLAEAPATGVEAKASPKPKTSKTAAKKTAAAPKPAGKPGRPKVQKVAEAKPVKAPKAPVRKAKAATGGDDLTKVKGVGDIVADMLKANGVMTFADMAATSYERYKELLKANGMSKFRNPATWAAQAAALAEVPTPVAEKKTPKQVSSKPNAKPKAEKPAEPAKKESPKGKPKAKTAPASGAASSGSDDLSKIKGIGDRVIEVLNEHGIRTYADVAATSVERFKEILKESNMSRFRDPSKWAELAAELMSAG